MGVYNRVVPEVILKSERRKVKLAHPWSISTGLEKFVSES